MKLHYTLSLQNPEHHQVCVEIRGVCPANKGELVFFLPRWSPGSYLIREYSRHLSNLVATNKKGERLSIEQISLSAFKLTFRHPELGQIYAGEEFTLSYRIFCHELTVRTAHVDQSHAFLHLPTLLLGIRDEDIIDPELKLNIPPCFSSVTTGLKEIAKNRHEFLWTAPNYDILIDCPIEVGCHYTDHFHAHGAEHSVAFYRADLNFFTPDFLVQLKEDMKKIVETIGAFFGGVPYDHYAFITHLVPGLYGGLEHLNSTALQFCPFQLQTRKGYLNFLCLVSHEYFHLWNVKRIRPDVLGPFDYEQEALTKLLWLSEGLTSFMDELFVYRAGLMGLSEYLDLQKDNLNRYFATPGKKFHSLDDSSFNAWIKLYRPDENLNNSSVSYYLKGGIVFWLLHLKAKKVEKSIDHFLRALFNDYKTNPSVGLSYEKVLKMIKDIYGETIFNWFETCIQTTVELNVQEIAHESGLLFEFDETSIPWMGIDPEFNGDRVLVKSVTLDGPAFQCGVNAGDEILAINGLRLLKDRYNDLHQFIHTNIPYEMTLSRLNLLTTVVIVPMNRPTRLKAIKFQDELLIKSYLE